MDERKERRFRLTKIRGSGSEGKHNSIAQKPDESSTLYFDYTKFELVRVDRCRFEDYLPILLCELSTAR